MRTLLTYSKNAKSLAIIVIWSLLCFARLDATEIDLSRQQVHNLLLIAEADLMSLQLNGNEEVDLHFAKRLAKHIVCLGEWAPTSERLEALFNRIALDPKVSQMEIPDTITFPDAYRRMLEEFARGDDTESIDFGLQVSTLGRLVFDAQERLAKRSKTVKK